MGRHRRLPWRTMADIMAAMMKRNKGPSAVDELQKRRFLLLSDRHIREIVRGDGERISDSLVAFREESCGHRWGPA